MRMCGVPVFAAQKQMFGWHKLNWRAKCLQGNTLYLDVGKVFTTLCAARQLAGKAEYTRYTKTFQYLTKDVYWSLYPMASEMHSFINGCHSKPLHSNALQVAANIHTTVAIGSSFDDPDYTWIVTQQTMQWLLPIRSHHINIRPSPMIIIKWLRRPAFQDIAQLYSRGHHIGVTSDRETTPGYSPHTGIHHLCLIYSTC